MADDPEVSFSSEADVLVVGSGIAGLSAAMAPLEAHRSVMIVDKLELLGGESYSATGVMYVSGSALQKRAGIATTTEQAWDARKQAYADAGIVDLDFAKRLFTTAPEWVDHRGRLRRAVRGSVGLREGGRIRGHAAAEARFGRHGEAS